MKVKLNLDKDMKFIGVNSLGHETFFDTSAPMGGNDPAPTPMEVMLEALAACTSMDIVSILRKKRKNVAAFEVKIEASRSEHHPRVFTHVVLDFTLTSADADIEDLRRSLLLSQGTYCSIAAMFKASGCIIENNTHLLRSE